MTSQGIVVVDSSGTVVLVVVEGMVVVGAVVVVVGAVVVVVGGAVVVVAGMPQSALSLKSDGQTPGPH